MAFKKIPLLILFLIAILISCSTKPRLTTHLADKNLSVDNVDFYLDLAREQLKNSIESLKNRKELTRSSGKHELKSVAQKRELRVILSRFLDYIAITQQIEEAFANYNNFQDIGKKHKVFLIHYEAFLLSYKSTLAFLENLGDDKALDAILNEKSDWLGIPKNSLAALKQYYLNVEIASRFAAYQVVNTYYSNQSGYTLSMSAQKDQDYIWEMGKGKGIAMTIDNGLKILQTRSKQFFFPTQKTISQMMGQIKVKRSHHYLITDQQIHKVQDKFQPGDIFLERREWYLSNIGIPGFWSHAAFYIGTVSERTKFFVDTESLQNWVKSKGIQSGDFETLLKTTYPDTYEKSIQLQENGYPPRMIEAIGKGVTFTTLEYSAGADSIGVLRPKLDKLELARAIFVAFSYYGKPYDFDFDFITDNKVVCSELIYKVYEPESPFKGIDFPITTMMDRKVSLPNHMVQEFDRSYQTEAQQLDLVLFIDGYEKEEKAFISNLDAFRESWKRPKWHIFIQEKGK